VTIASSEWTWVVTRDLQPGEETPQSNSYTVRFRVDDGTVSGSQYVSGLEKTVTWSGKINPDGSIGTINPDGSTTDNLAADAENQGAFSFTEAALQSPANPQTISGRYNRVYSPTKSETGSFTLTKRS
jgi:hypothetical protein